MQAMKVFCLGGAGKICRETAHDLVQWSDFERITIGDCDVAAGREVAAWLNDPRVDFVEVGLHDRDATIALFRQYDVVLDGTAISMNGRAAGLIAEAGAHGVNLNGFGEEYAWDELFKEHAKTFVPGFGMTPGITNMMARCAADAMDEVESVRVSHGAFRPFAFSNAIAETTVYEYDPALPGRVVFEDGVLKQVPPFARPLEVELPEPYGKTIQYIIPHPETVTLSQYLSEKGVKLIEVRGTWPQKNMQLVRALYEWGFLRNDRIQVGGIGLGIMDAVAQYLVQSPEGQSTELYGYSLHVEVVGHRSRQCTCHTLWHTHPPSDGSVPGWEKLRAYTRCVGIPMAIAAQLIARGEVHGTGTIIPERAFDPGHVFAELEKRGIMIHERFEAL
jgi:lysine 6-dehydrogenase